MTDANQQLASAEALVRNLSVLLQALTDAEGHDQQCRIVRAGGCSCGAWESRNVARANARDYLAALARRTL